MKKLLLVALATLAILCRNFAQFTTVNYDYERNWFNEGQALPAEKSMVFKGIIPNGTQIVELSIHSAKRGDQLYKASWAKVGNNELSLIVPYKLKSSNEYDFKLVFFRSVSETEKERLNKKIMTLMDTHIDVNVSGEKSIKFLKKNNKMLREMNELLMTSMAEYRNNNPEWKPQFSELVQLKLEQLEKSDLDKDYIKGDSTATRKKVRTEARQQLISDLKSQLAKEVDLILEEELFVIATRRFVDNYITESKSNNIAINAGYGGVYLSGDWDNFTYGASPYLGLAIPLGNSVLGSKFLSNSSITFGLFLDNFEDENGNTVTGLIVNRPVYLGLDHKLFKFIRINAGATFLEGINVPESPELDPSKKIMIKPYMGLSARIDLSLGLGK